MERIHALQQVQIEAYEDEVAACLESTERPRECAAVPMSRPYSDSFVSSGRVS